MISVIRALGHAQRLSELHADILALREHALDSEGRIRVASFSPSRFG
jgi:hypothetical protein